MYSQIENILGGLLEVIITSRTRKPDSIWGMGRFLGRKKIHFLWIWLCI